MNESRLDILLLEDSRFDAELLRESLARSYPGAMLTVVSDEDGFRRALAAASWSLILSDYELPGYSGAQALDHALATAPATPFVFVSGVIGEDNAVEMLKRGATDYVSKGRLSRLPLVIERAMREVQARDAQRRDAVALRNAKEIAERANEAKDRFLAVLSHELRTPLTPIVAATHLLERTATVPEELRHLLPMIRRNVALESRLIDDLLDVTAIGAGKVTLRKTSVDMHKVTGNVMDLTAELLREKGIALHLDLQAPEATVQGDEARMQQVLWNLIRNAVKFTPAGGRIELGTRVDGGRFVLTCRDTGEGIAASDLERIFTAFEQADPNASHSHGGLGLGLAIARGLVTEHGGSLRAHSEGPGQGATFILELDVEHAPLRAADPGAAEEVAESGEACGCRLLLVEDNVDAAETLAQILDFFGYRVTHAATCRDALRIAAEKEFDAVLTDLGLPDGSGIDVGRELSTRVPVVALSGYGAAPDLQRSAQAGFSGHLVKPADPQAIHEALQGALSRRSADLGRKALQTDSSVSR